ncbi:uncharacterized protein LOC135290784 isoform X2 [Passer domesticus]|uniref:uncharacterized protein LOC135290784 isoform X2 n=1 Tax=Passer domesticus TaxID=48849 RepID=UPI0030FE70AA
MSRALKTRQQDGRGKPSSVPGQAWVKEEEEEGPGAGPKWPPEKMEKFQPVWADPVEDLTEDQKFTQSRFRRRAQNFWKYVKNDEREETTISAIEGMVRCDPYNAEACAAVLDLLAQTETSNLKHVPAIVKFIHEWLVSNKDVSSEHRLDKSLLELTHAHPSDVVVTLLCSAPSCGRTAKMVLSELPCILEDWPEHSTCTSDGNRKKVFALAATKALWEIIHLPLSPEATIVAPSLFVALLVQVFCSTEQMPEYINVLWRRWQKREHLPTNPKRFAVLTVKALLCRLWLEDVVLAVERKRGWDALLNNDTHHYAVGLLAREMHRVSKSFCEMIAHYLVMQLCREESCWRVPAMAFLVEFLQCLEKEEMVDTILQLMSSHLQSDCKEMRRLVLRGLLVLCNSPWKARKLQSFPESLMELLEDADGELVGLTLSVLSKMLQDNKVAIAVPIGLQLAEALQPLFDNDTSHVQLLSICLFRELIVYLKKEGKNSLKMCVRQSLLPLFYHLYDENRHVAKASLETLLQATKFLKKRKFKRLLERDQLWRCSECLLAEDRNTTDKYWHQSLAYLQSSQESMREIAIKFIGLIGQHMRERRQEEFQIICDALLGMANDISPSVSTLADQTLHSLRTAQRNRLPGPLQLLQDQLCRVYRR